MSCQSSRYMSWILKYQNNISNKTTHGNLLLHPINPQWKWKSESQPLVSDSLQPHGVYSPWNSPGQNTGVGSCSFLQGIFPTQGLNPGFLHCRQILYQLSHQGSPRILQWVAYPFSSGSSWPGSPALQADSLPAELPGKPRSLNNHTLNLVDSHKHHSFLHLFCYVQIHQCSLSQTLLLALRLERAVSWMVGSSSMFVWHALR